MIIDFSRSTRVSRASSGDMAKNDVNKPHTRKATLHQTGAGNRSSPGRSARPRSATMIPTSANGQRCETAKNVKMVSPTKGIVATRDDVGPMAPVTDSRLAGFTGPPSLAPRRFRRALDKEKRAARSRQTGGTSPGRGRALSLQDGSAVPGPCAGPGGGPQEHPG